jgi:uncharacterized membrane protein YeaQ/YmgE (transglycosylase-associated protein family)
MKIILGLIGIFWGGNILVHQLDHFTIFPCIIGVVLVVVGWKILTGKIKL